MWYEAGLSHPPEGMGRGSPATDLVRGTANPHLAREKGEGLLLPQAQDVVEI